MFRRMRLPVLLLAPVIAIAAPALAEPRPFTVEVAGAVPGYSHDALVAYIAQTMSAAAPATWRFLPGSATAAPPGNRVEWSIHVSQSAAGTTRAYGFLNAFSLTHSSGPKHVAFELRLFVDGAYDTSVFSQALVADRPPSPEFDAQIRKTTLLLMADIAAPTAP